MNTPQTSPQAGSYDVVVVGGALSGAASALLLLQSRPGLKVLVVEKSTVFTRRVGEATVEVSAYYLTRVLGLAHHLNHQHLIKQGLRFWFANENASTLDQCSEIGGRYLARVPSFLVDRAILDEEVLRRAVESGAELWRPAQVRAVELNSGGSQKITVQVDGRTVSVQARWVIDASGVGAMLARQNGWLKSNDAHPTTALWSRWRGVKDLDSSDFAQRFPECAQTCFGLRATATNHLLGYGWWAWIIPLKGGDVSIGLVMDQRLLDWPDSDSRSLGARLKDFLLQHPVGRELLGDAQWQDGDVHWRKNLAYSSTTFAGDGFVLVGDAAGFLDPFYSPGLDWLAFTTTRAARLILAERGGEDAGPLVARHNRDFTRSYQRWFEAIYRDKYEYLGDYELMRLAFLLDLGLYYLGVVSQPYKRGPIAFTEPLFSTAPSVPFFHMMRFYHGRLARIGRSRRRRGVWGRQNAGRRFLFGGFTFHPLSARHLIRAFFSFAWLELSEGWRSWFTRDTASNRKTQAIPATLPAP